MPKWSQTWHGSQSPVHMDLLLIAECGALTVAIKKSKTSHTDAGLVLLVARGIGTRGTIGQYYRTIVYSNLISRKQNWNTYGQGIIHVTIQAFMACKVRIPDQVTDGGGTKQSAQNVPASFRATKYVNDVRYRMWDRTAVEDKNYDLVIIALFRTNILSK